MAINFDKSKPIGKVYEGYQSKTFFSGYVKLGEGELLRIHFNLKFLKDDMRRPGARSMTVWQTAFTDTDTISEKPEVKETEEITDDADLDF